MENQKRLRGRPKAFTDKTAQNRVLLLDRAVDVLECVSRNNGMTLSEIAEHLDQSPATIYRILSTLSARQVLEMDPESQEWFVGPASFRIGSAFLKRTGLVERARPIMRELMVQTGETANLGIEHHGEVMFLSQVETPENIRAFFPPGARSPMYASGIGKALLAHGQADRISDYVENVELLRFTANTICGKQELRVEMERIKAVGYAFDDEEKSEGMRCVAAPVFNNFGEVIAGLSISGPSTRLSVDKIEDVGKIVVSKAVDLSRSIGFQEPLAS